MGNIASKNDELQDSIDTFIIETVLILPIQDIVNKLINREFRDCDTQWLDDKLIYFLDFAAQTLGLHPPVLSRHSSSFMMNDSNTSVYIDSFSKLLNYFKKLVDY